MVYSILSEALIRSSVADQQPASRAYSITWDENVNLKEWSSYINLDIVGTWGGFLYATKTTVSGGFIGPSSTFTPIDSLVNDKIFFRMKYDKHFKNSNASNTGKIYWTTTADPTFDDTKSTDFTVISDGKWHLYEVDVGDHPQWVGLINRVRFYPCENGARNDEVFLNYFEIGTSDFTFSFDNTRAGSPGYVVGGVPLESEITISKDVNDKLLVNIDDYGFVQITLTAQTNTPSEIAKDLSLQLSKVSLGGYVRSQAFIDSVTNKLRIESGTRASDSSVRIMGGQATAAVTLGLVNFDQIFIGTIADGVDPADDYVPLSAYRPTTLELISLFDNDNDLQSFSLNPQEYIVQGGRQDFGTVSKQLRTTVLVEGRSTGFQGQLIETSGTFDFTGKTVIDVNHPFIDDGKLDKIFANGVLDTNGGSKWKIFRPRLNGDLVLIAEGQIGQTTIVSNPSGGLVLSVDPGIFVVDVSSLNINVRRGDLLGLYNGEFHVGTGATVKPDALYYEIEGDAIGTITPPPPSGAGESGLPMYARGAETKKLAVIDIDFKKRINLNELCIFGEEEERDLEYNIATSDSASFSASTPGSHTICYTINLTTMARQCDTRVNQAFNIQALNDNILFADNGVSAFGSPGIPGGSTNAGGATVAGATYFYVNGDGEFLGTHEYIDRDPGAFDFFKDPIRISCFFNSSSPRLTKPIGKAVIYFKDKKNQRSWQIEYAVDGGGDGSIQGFSKVPESSIYEVRVDNKIIQRQSIFTQKTSDLSEILLRNPVTLDTIADGQVSPPQPAFNQHVNTVDNIREQVTFIDFQWTRFEWNFDQIRTAGFQWYCPFHWSTKISEFQVFSTSRSLESLGDNAQVLFSSDGEAFSSASLISSDTGQASFRIGNSPRYIRLIFRPTLNLGAKDVQVKFENDQICFGPEGRLSSLSIEDSKVGEIGEATPLQIKNTTGKSSQLTVDIAPDTNSARQLLYFNKLTSSGSITAPDFGPPGKIDFTPDKILRETENVSINAKCYGLLDLTGFSSQATTDNLITNPSFETGNLNGWDLTVTQSGSLSFQTPRVYSLTNFDRVDSFQVGSYVFGFFIDELDPTHNGNSATVNFSLSQIIDVSAYSSFISTNGVECTISFPYIFHGVASNQFVFTIIEGETENDVNFPTVAAVRRFLLTQSSATIEPADQLSFSSSFTLKSNTQFIKLLWSSNSTGFGTGGAGFRRQGTLLDNISLNLTLPQSTKKWYKSWRTGSGDFSDSSYLPVTSFTTITGSSHWYQPFSSGRIYPLGPASPQVQGYSKALTFNRLDTIQSFQRMTPANPGMLGMSWEGEKQVAGFRIACGIVGTNTASFPRRVYAYVLKTESELGVPPDLNNPSHFKWVKVYSQVPLFSNPAAFTTNSSSVARMKIVTFLFDSPEITTGLKVEFTLNCDAYELNLGGWTNLTIITGIGCPSLGFTGFNSNYGLLVSMLHPLEKQDINILPIDNVKEAEQTGVTSTYAAVDLGRHHAINSDSDLLELIADTNLQLEWNASTVSYSSTDTANPNAVSWGNTTAANARWLRFSCTATDEMEYIAFSSVSGTVSDLPQASLLQARIYPDITTVEFPVEGYNSSWVDLGITLTDNDPTTFIYYSDYPVISIDLGKEYLINNDLSVPQNNHLLDAGAPTGDGADKTYWVATSETNFAYSTAASRAISDPKRVKYDAFGTGVPLHGVRWVAIKGDSNLLVSAASNVPKTYNFRTQGQQLSQVKIVPRTPTAPTENDNWFVTSRTGLRDISTIDATLGNIFSFQDGVDFGANQSNLGAAYFAFDGKFDELETTIWGVSVRDPITGQESSALELPHYIWRRFRDPYRGSILTKTVAAVSIRGYNELFYPTSFKLQKFKASASNPLLDSSWEDIPQTTFTSVNTWQDGLGFLLILNTPVETTGIRIYITDSEYPSEVGTNSLQPGSIDPVTGFAGTQTRVSNIVIYEIFSDSSNLQGTLDVDHVSTAQVTSITETFGNSVENIRTSNLRRYWESTGFEDTITITLPSEKPITRFEWYLDPSLGQQTGNLSSTAPGNFQLFAEIGSEDVLVINETSVSGTTYSGILSNYPVTSDTFKFKINSVQGQNEDAASIQLGQVRLIEEVFQSTPIVTVTGILAQRPGGTNVSSTKISYVPGTEVPVTVSLYGIDAGNDPYFSERDFFSLWLHINDVSLLDTQFGQIRIGNSPDVYYGWNLSSMNLVSGWNEIRLQFKEAAEKSVIEFQPGAQYNPNTGQSQVDFITGDVTITSSVSGNFSTRVIEAPGIRFFAIEFRGTKGSSSLELIVDDLRFVRNKFDDVCKFAPSLYLNNDELFSIFLNGVDLAAGTIEFWICPDWDSAGRLSSNRTIVPCLFRIIRPDNKFLSLIYRPSQGFVCIISDGSKVVQFASSAQLYPFNRFDTFHFALAWDKSGGVGGVPGATVAMYVNGSPVFGSDKTWDGVREGGSSVLIGGEAGQRLAAPPLNATAGVFTPISAQPLTATESCWAVLENVKIYNYAKTDFSDRNDPNVSKFRLINPSEMIQISSDNSNFYGIGSNNLPLTYSGIADGQSGTVYVRTNIPSNLTGEENRDASLLVRWIVPNPDCGGD